MPSAYGMGCHDGEWRRLHPDGEKSKIPGENKAMNEFFSLAESAWNFYAPELALTPGIIPVALGAFVLASLVINFRGKGLSLSGIIGALFPLTATVLILTFGIIFENQPSSQNQPSAPWPSGYEWLPAFGWLLGALIALAMTVKLKGMRLSAAAISLFILWYNFWCYIVATIAITGDGP